MKAVSYDVFLCAWYRALNGATPSKLTTRADPDDDRFGRGGCRHRAVRFSGWAADAARDPGAALTGSWPGASRWHGLRGMDVRRGPMHNDRGLHGLAVTRS